MLLSFVAASVATLIDPSAWARTLAFVVIGAAVFILLDNFWLSRFLAAHRQRQIDAARRARRERSEHRRRPAPPGGAG